MMPSDRGSKLTCTWMATTLDQEQIELTSTIAPRVQAVETMPDRTGIEVAAELGNRLLVRYLVDSQVNEFTGGSLGRAHWVTPTAISSKDVVGWLALPSPRAKRQHALFLNPAEIDVIRGPAWVRLGQGIEYYLPNGFPAAAVVDVGAVQVR